MADKWDSWSQIIEPEYKSISCIPSPETLHQHAPIVGGIVIFIIFCVVKPPFVTDKAVSKYDSPSLNSKKIIGWTCFFVLLMYLIPAVKEKKINF